MRTITANPEPNDMDNPEDNCDDALSEDDAKELLKSVWSAVNDEKNQHMTTNELFTTIGMIGKVKDYFYRVEFQW